MNQEIKKRALRRLKILEGQVRGIQDMVTDEVYCVDIITQSSAVKSALSGFEDLILENHLSTHIVEHMKHGKTQQAIQEIMDIYKLSKNK
jgi:DNA-binding FrmR family transcriptional regulator